MLKLVHPHRESEHEADGLELWGGDGAVRLLALDDTGDVQPLERCEPGTPLSRLDADAALDAMIGLLPRLWRRAEEPFHTWLVIEDSSFHSRHVETATWLLEAR